MTTHEEKIKRISNQLKNYRSDKPISLKKKSVSHQVPKVNDKKYSDNKIDISDLNKILFVDAEKKICVAEPGVTFADLVRETSRYNLVPMTVPEHKAITIGGAIAGCSIESMSYKYSGFHDSCLEYEVITSDGKVINCSPEKDKLLFQTLHGTFGTLGIISKLTFKLIDAKPFVKLNYEKYFSLEDYKKAILEFSKKKETDFIDGIIYSPKEYILCVGKFVDAAPYTRNYNWMNAFCIDARKRKEDYLKTFDYFFRYDKGTTTTFTKNPVTRFFFGKLFSSTNILKIANKFRKIITEEKLPITIDLFIPFSKAEEFFEWYNQEINYFPLWCVPYKRKNYEWISDSFLKNIKDDLFLDIAIYEMRKENKEKYYRMFEDEIIKINGLKTLISNNYFSEKDFWKIWNKKNYDEVKKQTDPKNIFRGLYEKTCRASMGK